MAKSPRLVSRYLADSGATSHFFDATPGFCSDLVQDLGRLLEGGDRHPTLYNQSTRGGRAKLVFFMSTKNTHEKYEPSTS